MSISRVVQGGGTNITGFNEAVNILLGNTTDTSVGTIQFITTQFPTANTLTISSLPAFQYYILQWTAHTANATGQDNIQLQFNGDTASHYAGTNNININGVMHSGISNPGTSAQIGYTASAQTAAQYYGGGFAVIGGAQQATLFPTFAAMSSEYSSSGNVQSGFLSGMWLQATAITSITLLTSQGNAYTAGSVFSLYGAQ